MSLSNFSRKETKEEKLEIITLLGQVNSLYASIKNQNRDSENEWDVKIDIGIHCFKLRSIITKSGINWRLWADSNLGMKYPYSNFFINLSMPETIARIEEIVGSAWKQSSEKFIVDEIVNSLGSSFVYS